MQADGAGGELAGVVDLVHGLARVDGAGLCGIHLDDIGGLNLAAAGGEVFEYGAVVLHQQAADGHGHPAVLLVVVVDRADLAHVPANGD